MMSSINVLYDLQNKARSAMSTLVAAGISEESIRLVVGPLMPEFGSDDARGPLVDADALQGVLGEVGLPQEAWDAYWAKLIDGGAMLNLRAEEAELERVMGILKDHGSVDVEQRVATWRAEGWGGTSPVSTEGWGGYSATSTGGTHITASED